MAWVAADWKITRSSKEIEYIGDLHAGTAPSYVTGIELHRALMDLADAPSDTGDDQIAIIDLVPSQRLGADTNVTLLNGYTLTSATAEGPEEHIYDTSITYGGGTDIYDGIQVFGNSTNIQIIQNGSRIDNDFWNQPKMIAAVEDAASSTSHRFLIKTRTAGADIDGRRLIGTQRELGTVYTEFSIGGGTARGNNVLALTANNDLNNNTIDATIAGWDTITNASEGYVALDANADTTNEFYYSNWTKATFTINQFYERAKWIQARVAGVGVATPARDADQSLYGLPGDVFRGITHSVAITPGTGTWIEPESLAWGTGATAGTGQLLAVDDNDATATSILYLQLLTGVPPNANLITGNGGATGTAGTVTAQLISLPFVGASTGSAIIGAYGVGILPADLAVNDSVTSLDGNPLSPPNNVTFSVTGLDITGGQEDYVLVGPESGGLLDLTFDTVVGPINGAAVTSIVVTTAIPTDVPATGSIRLQNDEGRYVKIPYTSYTGSTYTIPSYNFSGTGDNDSVANGNNYFPTWLDEQAVTATESVTVVYDAPRNLLVRVRNGNTGTPAVNPIVPWETVAILGSTGGSQAASRVLDL
jgi:hypothetical protein